MQAVPITSAASLALDALLSPVQARAAYLHSWWPLASRATCMQAHALSHVCVLQICTAVLVAFTPVTAAQARQHLTNDERETVQMFKKNVASVCFIVSLQNRWVIVLIGPTEPVPASPAPLLDWKVRQTP